MQQQTEPKVDSIRLSFENHAGDCSTKHACLHACWVAQNETSDWWQACKQVQLNGDKHKHKMRNDSLGLNAEAGGKDERQG